MPHEPPSTTRLDAFSDGVIAVIITIMVLDLKVPHEDGVEGLEAVFPILLVYLLSFAFVGIYWINHHHLIGRLETADPLVLYANLSFLFSLSLLPFATAYLLEKKMDAFAVSLYTVSMLVAGFSFLLLRLAVHRRLRRAGTLQAEDKAAKAKHLASLVLYLIAIPLAYWHTGLAMGAVALVAVLWIVPDLSLFRNRDE